jgi:Zinc finger, C2H2 type
MDLICKICNKVFKGQSSLSRHGRIHKGLKETCACGLSFSRRDSLKRHQIMSKTCKALEQASDDSFSVSKGCIDKTLNVNECTQAEEEGEDVVDDDDDDDSDSKIPDFPISITNHKLINLSKDNINTPTPTSKNQKSLKKHKIIKSHQSSDDDSDSPTPASPTPISKHITNKRKLINTTKNMSNFPKLTKPNQKREMTKTRYNSDDDSDLSTQESSNDDSDSPKPIVRKRKFRLSRIKKIRKLLKSKKQRLSSKPQSGTNLFADYGIDPSYSGSNIFRRMTAVRNLSHFAPKQQHDSMTGLFGQLSSY